MEYFFETIKQNPRFKYALVVALVLFGLFVLGLLTGGGEPLVNTAEDDNVLLVDEATLENTNDLEKVVGRSQRFLLVSKDIHAYAKIIHEEYSGDIPVTFIIESSEDVVDGEKGVFVGRFMGIQRSKTTLKVTSLDNEQAEVSLTGERGENIDSLLASARQENRFLAKLPIEEPLFVVDFFEDESSYYVIQNSTNNKFESAAIRYIEQRINRTIDPELELFTEYLRF